MGTRRTGRIVVIAMMAVALGVSGVGIWLLFRGKPEPADFVEVVALDGEYALVVRDLSRGDERDFFSLYHVHEGERWGAMIPPYPYVPGRLGVAASPNVATVRVIKDGFPQVLGFAMHGALKAGRLAVSEPRTAAADGYTPADVATVSDVTQAFELLRSSTAEGVLEVVATEIDRGSVSWRREVAGGTAPVWLRPDVLIVSKQGGGLVVLDREDGAPRAIAGLGATCVADGFVELGEAPGFAGRCGRRGDAVLYAAERDGHAWVVAIDAATRVERWRADLGAGSFAVPGMELIRRRTPDADPFSGALAPTLPILLTGGSGGAEAGAAGAPGAARMVALDTTTGELLGTVPSRVELAGARLLRDGERSYLFVPATSLLVSFDPTGRITGMASTAGFAEVWPAQLAETHVWLHDARRLVVLDGVDLSVAAATTNPPPALADPTTAAADLGLPTPVAP